MGATRQQRGMSRRAAEAEAECVRLRGLLNIAREWLEAAIVEINDVAAMPVDTSAYRSALRRSNPDATPATEVSDGESV